MIERWCGNSGGMSMSKPNILNLSLSKLERDNPCTQQYMPTEPQQPGLRELVKASLLDASFGVTVPRASLCPSHQNSSDSSSGTWELRGSWEADGGRRSCQSIPDSLSGTALASS